MIPSAYEMEEFGQREPRNSTSITENPAPSNPQRFIELPALT